MISKTTTLHVHHACLYILLPFLHHYDVKMPTLTFYGDVKKRPSDDEISFLSLKQGKVLRNSAPGGFACILKIESKWLGIVAMKAKRTQIHFLSYVFAAVSSSDLKAHNFSPAARSGQRRL